ncbi:hypothetical protein VDG1235_1025 [Verrucomicrobiia bacterium DG1235]|nr:hypothetical protein VDG1235_1025 [Verrucomicrobiae bacterium DG1235]
MLTLRPSLKKSLIQMPEKKTSPKKAAKKATAKTKAPAKKAAKKATKKNGAAASGFSLDDALAIASTRADDDSKKISDVEAKEKARKALEEAEAKKQKQSFGAASLADILGYNPAAPTPTVKKRDEKDVPAKYKKFYALLIELRDHVKNGLNTHAEETLKRSSKDDSGDLSGYSQHMADAGTDTFDRDFALSMVSSEQDALQEIEEAIDRIFKGTYGICEMTGKQIREERLMAVPFTRYSMKTQEQIEKNTFRSRNQVGGVFADASSEDSLNYGSDENDDN